MEKNTYGFTIFNKKLKKKENSHEFFLKTIQLDLVPKAYG
jgi:hypothetical protein